MSYAIEVLEKETAILEKCLSKWQEENYPEARKERNSRLKDLVKAIEFLKLNKL